ncbi:MAG TPA: outer membrane beta-barrel protein [Bacteroidales bacterium]|nr:outer membrane beta-barrel protein [Bacteroidales bacterium]
MVRICLIVSLILSSGLSYSQHFYLKPHLRYHTPLTYQKAPEFFTANMFILTGSDVYYTSVITENKKFSLAKGTSYGADIGFRINEHIAIELGFDYFRNNHQLKSDSVSPNYPLGSTAWQLRVLNAIPALVLSQPIGKNFAFSAKAGFVAGVTSLGKSIIFEEKRRTFMFNKSLDFGYTFGAEIEYRLLNHVGVSIEAGVENIFYKPRKAILKEDNFSYWDMDELPRYLKSIVYKRKIDNEQVYYDNMNDTYYTNYYKPLMRLKETLKLNSMYGGININYSF